MKKREKFKLLMLGLIIGATLSATVAIAAPQLVEIVFGVRVSVDGQIVHFEDDMRPFVLDGRTFLPVRAMADIVGLNVDFNEATNTVVLTSGAGNVVTPTPVPTPQPTPPPVINREISSPAPLAITIFDSSPINGSTVGTNAMVFTALFPGNIVYRVGPTTGDRMVAQTTHNLGGNFHTLTTQITHIATSRTADVTFNFIGDGQVLASVTRERFQTAEFPIDVNVTGVNVLRIEMHVRVDDTSFGPIVAPTGNNQATNWQLIAPTLH